MPALRVVFLPLPPGILGCRVVPFELSDNEMRFVSCVGRVSGGGGGVSSTSIMFWSYVLPSMGFFCFQPGQPFFSLATAACATFPFKFLCFFANFFIYSGCREQAHVHDEL